MRDGYSSRPQSSLGLGLGAAKRAVDDFEITTSKKGTSVTLRRYFNLSTDDLNTGVVSYPAVNGTVNGDLYLIKPYEGEKLLIALVDGAGKGQKANACAKQVIDVFREHYKLPLDELVRLGHKRLESSNRYRGAELGLVRITHDQIEYLMMGSPRLFIHAKKKAGINIHDGSLGISIPGHLNVTRIARPPRFTLLIHSDGIVNVDCPDLLASTKSAQKIAESVFDRYALAQDDATVIVVDG